MHSWSDVAVPTLPATPAVSEPLEIFDTRTQSRLPSPGTERARETQQAQLYVCGITPYDATHIGHANTYVVYDTIQRVWRDKGFDVAYVQNITDIDDPLLERAAATGQNWEELAHQEIDRFRGDMVELRVLPPTHYVGAVEAMGLIVERIEELVDKSATYCVENDLYFKHANDPAFGGISHLTPVQMLELSKARGGDPDRPGKEHPLDAILWQAARPGEPSWPSQLGAGRPGWHIECAAIALKYLQEPIDMQGGGRDLIFPHHELGTSQAHVLTDGIPFAQTYVHSALVGYQGEKMSKSLGNLVFVSKLREDGVTGAVIRLALLAHHFHTDWEWTDADLQSATQRYQLWQQAASHPGDTAADLAVVDAIRASLNDNLDTPQALAHVDRWAQQRFAQQQGSADSSVPSPVVTAVDALLGIAL